MFTSGIATELAIKRITYYFVLEKKASSSLSIQHRHLRGFGEPLDRGVRMFILCTEKRYSRLGAHSCQFSPSPGTTQFSAERSWHSDNLRTLDKRLMYNKDKRNKTIPRKKKLHQILKILTRGNEYRMQNNITDNGHSLGFMVMAGKA